MRRCFFRGLLVWGLITAGGTLSAGVMTKAASEAAEYVMKTFGKEAADQGVKKLSTEAERLAVKHGDEALTAFRKVGPKAITLIDDAGEQGPEAVKLLAKYGDEAAWVAAKPERLARVSKLGDEGAEALIRHQQVAVPLLDELGAPAAQAMKGLSKQEGRRLAMMSAEGELKKIGRTEELLKVIGKYGDKGMDFVWRNKVVLGSAAVLAAFLNDPEPYIEGILKPVASIPGQVASEAAKSIDWTVLSAVIVGAGTLLLGVGMLRRKKGGALEN